MNISASKLLLGLSVAAYTYCTWDHLFSNNRPDDAVAKASALAPALVNGVKVLSLGRDAFDSVALDRTEDTKTANAIASAMGHSLAGKLLGPLSLQGIFMTPTGHAALINGVPVNEGEATELEAGGAKIFARKIGDNYAVVEGGGRTVVLKLEDAIKTPEAVAAPASSSTPAPSTPAPSARPSGGAATSSNPNPAGHGGGSDPYAGHRTGHH